MARITVIDAIMGAGKTTTMFDMMEDAQKTDPHKRFIYIAPYLDEITRIRETLPELEFDEPTEDDPKHRGKFVQLKGLVREGGNIASTHACFKHFDKGLSTTLQLPETPRYTLVIDETLPVVEKYGELTSADFKMLLANGHIHIDGSQVKWNESKPYDGKFNRVANECRRGTLVYIGGNLLIWQFPAWFLTRFDKVYICTYMFEGSLMSHYLKYNRVNYDLTTLKDYEIVPYHQGDNLARKRALAELISVVDDKRMNRIGEPVVGRVGAPTNPLSKGWFMRESKIDGRSGIDTLKSNTVEFFKRTAKVPANERMWTALKDYRSKLKGHGYSKADQFIPFNTKGTNKYRDRSAVAYLFNNFLDPNITRYFREHDIEAREELFALSELAQWVFRSRIRDDKPIMIYIPSLRMRNLFNLWLRASDQSIVDLDLAEKLKGEWTLRDKAVDKVLNENDLAIHIEERMERADLTEMLKLAEATRPPSYAAEKDRPAITPRLRVPVRS